MLYNRLFMRAGVRKVKDLAYEYVKGFLPNRAIYDCVVGWDDEIEKAKWMVNVKTKKKPA